MQIATGMNEETAFPGFYKQLMHPPREYGMIPFWFWNDDLDEDELLRQLYEFYHAGFGGVLIHARIGLSRSTGYLTETYFKLVQRVVQECAVLGMKVILYDEGSYPSGSACGKVVAENPQSAARALTMCERTIKGPWRGYWRPSAGRGITNRLISVVMGSQNGDGSVDPESLQAVTIQERGVVRIDAGRGSWRVMAVWDVPSGGTIRGVYPDQEDGSATAPPAGDLMNPEAVSAFIKHTHEQYARYLSEYLGSVVVGMFTDEPNPLGRGARRGLWPYTPGFEHCLSEELGRDIRSWLPALWVDYGPETQRFRRQYQRAVKERVRKVFYGAQASWCKEHGLALTGHPADSNDMTSPSVFDWPGQDMVWRWVLPGSRTALEGENSVAAKAATSAARANNRHRVLTEVGGAYGWQYTLDEAKWLLDWHLVRGNNLINPHACFYSVRGGRAYESEPDIGVHNAWWPYWGIIARYCGRLSWLLTGCVHVCRVAILGDGYALPWMAAKHLYQHQIDFLYIDSDSLSRARVKEGQLHVGTQSYSVVVIDGDPELSADARAILADFRSSGGCVLEGSDYRDLHRRIGKVLERDISIDNPQPDLRFIHVKKGGYDVYLLVNEGEKEIKGRLEVAVKGRVEIWDPLREQCQRPPVRATGRGVEVPVTLGRRESRLLVIGSNQAPETVDVSTEVTGKALPVQLDQWIALDEEDNRINIPAPGDWTTVQRFERFSGTVTYRSGFSLPGNVGRLSIDMGNVGDIAEVVLNGETVGCLLWSPYRLDIRKGWNEGTNQIEVKVTNSSANYYEGAMRPSGLMGPVSLMAWRCRRVVP